MSVATRRQRERAERRRTILDAAKQVFAAKGFQAATMDEVAAAAELSKGTLYLYFKNKDDLFFALSIDVLDDLVLLFERQAAGDGVGIDDLRLMLVRYAAKAEANPEQFRTLVGSLSSGHVVDTTAPGFARHREMVARLIAAMVATIRRGQDDASIRADLDPVQTAAQLWGGIYGILQIQINRAELNRRAPQPIDFDSFVSGYVDLLCRGLHESNS